MAKGSIGSGYELIIHPISSLSQRCASMLRFARATKKLGALHLTTAYGGHRALNQLASSKLFGNPAVPTNRVEYS